jgi:predicted metal-dependent phosphoesterase TrpH
VKVDFHVHSAASDGTMTPASLAEAGSGFAAMALTDHDNADGAEEFLGASSGRGRFAGIELSIEPGEGFDKFHLLGIGVDWRNIGLQRFLRRILEGRNERNRMIIENFRRLGIEMEAEDDVSAYANGDVLARPHFARWLAKHGYTGSVIEAFEKYLLPDSPRETRCYESRWHPPQEDAIGVLHDAGALAVMAHPKYWRDEWKRTGCDFAAARRGLAELKEKGLDALEALYQANTPEEDVEFTRIASSIGLLKSAGSDFHGANKPAVKLGMEVSERFIAPFLERLGM